METYTYRITYIKDGVENTVEYTWDAEKTWDEIKVITDAFEADEIVYQGYPE